MALAPPESNDNHDEDNSKSTSFSFFLKTVCLYDWWLIKAEKDSEGKRLAVAGLTSRGQQAVRVFSSAPILKIYDLFTLETVDGVCIILKGFINKVHTKENGFPSEVFNHFVFGFPPFWETYAKKCLDGVFSNKDVPSMTFGCDKLSTESRRTPGRRNKKATKEERHDNSNKIDLILGNCGNMVPIKGQHELQGGICNNSSAQDPNICCSPVVSELSTGHASNSLSIPNIDSNGIIERYPTAFNEVCTAPTAGPVNSDVHDVQSDALENSSLSLYSGVTGSIPSTIRTRQTRRECLPAAPKNTRTHELPENSCDNMKSPKPHISSEDNIRAPLDSKQVQVCGNISRADEESRNISKKKEANAKEASTSKENTRRKLTYESPLTQGRTENVSFLSTESLSFKRSRSGRLLLPSLEFWRNQMAIYDADRQVTGIQEGLQGIEPSKARSRSEPQRKCRQLT